MAARRKGERIEPSFGGSGGGEDEIRISPDDRAVASTGRPPRGRQIDGEAARRVKDLGSGGRGGRRGAGGGSGGGGNDEGGRGFFGGRPRRRRSFLGHLVRLSFLLVFWGGIAGLALIGYFAIKLPQEAWAIPDRPPNVKIVSVSGDLLADRGTTGGEAVALDRISPYVPQAVMAIEDRRFYSHWGVDPVGILRAFSENLAAGDTVQGGSTLTQQLAKNIFLTPDQTLQRKIQEAILSLWLETKFSKDQILEMYLNRVYFGSGATGIQAAARRYFDKNADELNLIESATLAGLLKAPSRLSPARDPEAARARAGVVLQAMLEEGKITKAEFDDALASKPTKAKSFWTGPEHYAADMVMRDLPLLVGGEIKEDVVVDTTIDLTLEKEAQKAIAGTIDRATQNVTQGALVSIDGTGAIRAIVGGRDYAASQFNRAVDAKRQPGSAFKPFVYETALEYGVRPETVMNDGPVKIGNWSPSNYDNRFRGPVTVADALMRSLNTIAAQLTAEVGPAAVIETAKRMGIQSPLVDNASLALGTSEVSLLELTGAYATFANGGYRATPHLVNKVTTVSGKVLYQRDDAVPPVIVTSDIVGMMNAMMTRVISSGTGRRAALKGWQAAGKSGTTQDFKDAWFVGFTANLTTGVWLGNDNGKPMRQVTGGSLPADAWKAFMTAAHEGLPAMPLPGDYRIGEPGNQPMASGYGDRIIGYDTEGNPVYESNELPGPGFEGGAPQQATGELPPAAAPGSVVPGQDGYAERSPRGEPRYEPQYRSTPGYRDLPAEPDYARRPPPRGEDPYGDDEYGGPPPEYGYGEPARMRPPADIGPPRTVGRNQLPPDAVLEGPAIAVSPDQLPPDAVLEGPAPGGRASDRSLFRGLFGGG
ncbi:transglycosylase domain-containing protein [Aureimonas sp. Leaf324]|jgi:penicillin-binding protein 1A|uniref:transglycosylase domain-containing protein n=1 Tax=Aureimonas sp. Leaf324 TaxID=1736336 RepID=UPI00070207B1|nr:transglycosylase domain-containing protein [Aureimonas sp. Leaf324]KQQ80667.1 penicillin-binding protein 1A [Aureimonas sp. Leaf324]